MKRIRIIGLALLALAAVSATAASSASAICPLLELGYCVNGVPLLAGSTKEVTASAKTPFVLKGELLGLKSVTTCQKLKLNAAQKPTINGGMPGTGAKQKTEFEECTATLGGAACAGVVVGSALSNTTQTMVALPAGLKGRLATLFTPSSGSVFTSIKLTNCGGFSTTAEVTGTTAALNNPERTEGLDGELIWNEPQEITEVELSGGTKEAIGLKFGGKPAGLLGTALILLVSKEKWGVF